MKVFTFLLMLAGINAFSQTPAGFRSITRFDNTRPAVEEQADKAHGRIIQINVWYPAERSAEKMTFSDYVGLAGLELDSSRKNDWYTLGVSRYFSWPESAKADKKTFLDFLHKKTPMNAGANAPFLTEKYPLIMLVHGYAADHAYLAENLAGKGFVVVQVPVKGTRKTELDYETGGLETQVLDYEYALKVVQNEFAITTNDIGVVGFSFGGQSALALALKNENILSVVSLDGGIGSDFGARLLQSQAYYDLKKLNKPILHAYNPRDAYTDLSWLKTAPQGNRWLVAMKNMEHGHFTSFGLLNKWLPGIMGKEAPDPGRGYESLITITTGFFEQTVKAKACDKSFVTNLIAKNKWMAGTVVKHEFIS